MLVVLSLGAGVAHAATEYLYRLDGVEALHVHVEGAGFRRTSSQGCSASLT